MSGDWAWTELESSGIDRVDFVKRVASDILDHGHVPVDAPDVAVVAAAILSSVVLRSDDPDDPGVTLWTIVRGGSERWRMLLRLGAAFHGSVADLWELSGLLLDDER